ncbi:MULTISPECIES: M16 family metallopeptidase [Streptomyces]|uniref:M16 family metallopeptidase n=1 Tax=Streptomyces TaxID=1883 RepID=UPI000691F812|nr:MULTISPECIES: M16 family metallopeptidase [Streptomyces]
MIRTPAVPQTRATPDAAPAGGGLHKRTLSNGLRVVLSPHWPTPRAAVAVHYGVGFRSEQPGQEGMAHLFEHLMFRGSASIADGAFFDGLLPLAGAANGTTHQDYTDYFQTVPAQALEQALFREADRMRAPRFAPAELSAQLVEVAREIRHMRDGRPYGGFPWPLLPQALFRTFANAHDGYGDPELLGRITPEDCARFFDAYYAPSNAVLTVVGPQGPEELGDLVERHFGDIPARAVAGRQPLGEPEPDRDRLLRRTDPQAVRTAVAVGHLLPDPATELPAYVANMVLAELTGRPGASSLPRPFTGPVGAGCGFFGPLDALSPDVLVVTSLLPAGQDPEDFTGRLTDWWSRLRDPLGPAASGDDAVAAARSLAARHRRDHADLQRRCRALGRLELLHGRAELALELPGLLTAATPEQVASAAAALADAHRAVLVLEPGEVRGGPACAPPPAVPAPGPAGEPAGPTRPAVRPRPMPPLGDPVAPAFDGARETVLGNGLRVMAVPDRRAGLIEVRLRVSLGPVGWRRPERAAGLLGAADRAATASVRAMRLGGELQVSTGGQWADVSAWAPAREFPRLLGIVADLLDPARLPDGSAQPGNAALRRSPEHRMDGALRLHWLGPQAAPEGTGTETLAELHRALLSPGDAVLVVVGDVSPRRAVDEAARALGAWRAAAPARTLPASRPLVPATAGAPDVLVLREPSAAAVHLTLCAPEPPREGHGDAARYLATALLGGHFGARLAERCRRLGRAEHVVFAARDLVGDRARALVRVTAPRRSLADAVQDVREETAALAAAPPGREELDTVRQYCAAQLLTAFDSPGLLADALRHTMVSGRGLEWVIRRPRLLGEVSGEAVSQAARALFVPVTDTVVVLGDVGPAHEVAAELAVRR